MAKLKRRNLNNSYFHIVGNRLDWQTIFCICDQAEMDRKKLGINKELIIYKVRAEIKNSNYNKG